MIIIRNRKVDGYQFRFNPSLNRIKFWGTGGKVIKGENRLLLCLRDTPDIFHPYEYTSKSNQFCDTSKSINFNAIIHKNKIRNEINMISDL